MRRFLKNIITFFICFYGLLIMLLLSSNFLINRNADFRLEAHIDKIILGNSQPECAYNDSLISNFKNLAKSAETYFYSYQKLKKILEQNPQITSIFIEFNPTSILVREDEKIWEDRYINHHLPNYYPFLEFSDHQLLGSKNSIGYQHATLKSLYYNMIRVAKNQYSYLDSIGGYLYLKRNKIQSALESISNRTIKQKNLKSANISTHDLNYLDKMIHLCLSKSIEIYLIRSPYHKHYQGNIYESDFQKIKTDRYSDIQFIDFKDFPIEISEFGDLQHLNYKGARKFSKWFDLWIQKRVNK